MYIYRLGHGRRHESGLRQFAPWQPRSIRYCTRGEYQAKWRACL